MKCSTITTVGFQSWKFDKHSAQHRNTYLTRSPSNSPTGTAAFYTDMFVRTWYEIFVANLCRTSILETFTQTVKLTYLTSSSQPPTRSAESLKHACLNLDALGMKCSAQPLRDFNPSILDRKFDKHSARHKYLMRSPSNSPTAVQRYSTQTCLSTVGITVNVWRQPL